MPDIDTTGLFAALERRGVRFCILRGFEELPHRVEHDLDMVVAPGDIDAFELALAGYARDQELTLLSRVEHLLCTHYRLVDAGLRPDRWLQVDAHSRGEGWRGVLYLSAEEIVAAAVPHGDFRIARPSHEAATRLFTSLLAGGTLKRKHLPRIGELVAEDGSDFRDLLARGFGRRFADLVIAAIDAGEPERIEAAVGMGRRALLFSGLTRDPFGTAARMIGFVAREFGAMSTRPGAFVCFVGPDGVGKTSLANALAGTCRWAFSREIRYFHGRPPLLGGLATSPATPGAAVPKDAGGAARGGGVHPGAGTGRLRRLVRRLLSPLRIVKSLIQYGAGYALRVYPAMARECLVMGDRYYYEYFLNPGIMKYGGSEGALWAALRLIPEPDIVYVLTGDPKAVHARKPELPVADIARQNRVVGEIGSRLRGPRVVPLDADQPAERVAEAAASALLGTLRERSRAVLPDAPGDAPGDARGDAPGGAVGDEGRHGGARNSGDPSGG